MRLSFCWINALLLAGWIHAQAQSGDPYPPSPVPDRIILTWREDPATTQSVTWRTDVSVSHAWAEIAPAVASPDQHAKAIKVPATTQLLTTNNNKAHTHSVTFRRLQPNTQYAYRVGDGTHWSEWFHFRTAARNGATPFSFLYFGDAQNEIKSLWSRCIRQAYSSIPDVDFLLHVGDLVQNARYDEEWGEWFYAGGWIYGMTPTIAVPGNHEYFWDGNGTKELTAHWRSSFELPTNGPPGLEETAYYLDYQGARIIGLNTQATFNDSSYLTLQREWLEEVLKKNPQRWTIVTQHHPVYSTKYGRDNSQIRNAFQPLFEKYKVDLVLQGHDHSYGRGHNLDQGVGKLPTGPVYVVSVSGPKMYDLNFEKWLERVASTTQLYQLIRIKGRKLNYEAYTTTGELYDAFELRKRLNGKNRFIDQAPKNVMESCNLPAFMASRMSEKELQEYRERFKKYMRRKYGDGEVYGGEKINIKKKE